MCLNINLKKYRDPASVRNAALPSVLNFFQMLFAESDERVVKILNGKLKPRPRDKIYESVDNKIQNSLNEYDVNFLKISK